MAEELQESEVLFQEDPEDVEDTDEASGNKAPQDSKESCNKTKKRRKLKIKTSHGANASSRRVPLSFVYQNLSRRSSYRYSDFVDGFGEDYGDVDDGEFVPPHIIIRRRFIGRAMSFSMCSGVGRTLKGRDLCEFRQWVFMRTGFLQS